MAAQRSRRANQGMSDDPRQATESGEPKRTGRSSTATRAAGGGTRGNPGGSARARSAKGNVGRVGEDRESGRHDTVD